MAQRILNGFLATLLSILKEAVGPKILTAALKLRRARRKPDELFWDRIAQLQLMLHRLNDSEIDSSWCRRAVESCADPYQACCTIYGGLLALSMKLHNMAEPGFEIDPWWLTRLNSASSHFDQYLLEFLNPAELEAFHEHAVMIAKACWQHPEIKFARAKGGV